MTDTIELNDINLVTLIGDTANFDVNSESRFPIKSNTNDDAEIKYDSEILYNEETKIGRMLRSSIFKKTLKFDKTNFNETTK